MTLGQDFFEWPMPDVEVFENFTPVDWDFTPDATMDLPDLLPPYVPEGTDFSEWMEPGPSEPVLNPPTSINDWQEPGPSTSGGTVTPSTQFSIKPEDVTKVLSRGLDAWMKLQQNGRYTFPYGLPPGSRTLSNGAVMLPNGAVVQRPALQTSASGFTFNPNLRGLAIPAAAIGIGFLIRSLGKRRT